MLLAFREGVITEGTVGEMVFNQQEQRWENLEQEEEDEFMKGFDDTDSDDESVSSELERASSRTNKASSKAINASSDYGRTSSSSSLNLDGGTMGEDLGENEAGPESNRASSTIGSRQNKARPKSPNANKVDSRSLPIRSRTGNKPDAFTLTRQELEGFIRSESAHKQSKTPLTLTRMDYDELMQVT